MAKKHTSKRQPAGKRHRNGGPDGPVPPLNAVPHVARGTLIIIGGNEHKEGHMPALDTFDLQTRVPATAPAAKKQELKEQRQEREAEKRKEEEEAHA